MCCSVRECLGQVQAITPASPHQMHQQSHFPGPGQPQPAWGGTSRTPAGPHGWAGAARGSAAVRAGGDQSQQRSRTRSCWGSGQPRERFLCSPGLSQCSLRNQGHTGDVCGHCSHTELWGMRSLETERLVSPVSQFAEGLQFFFQPTGAASVPDVQRGNGKRELQNCAQEPHSKYNRLELNVLTPS